MKKKDRDYTKLLHSILLFIVFNSNESNNILIFERASKWLNNLSKVTQLLNGNKIQGSSDPKI